MKNNKLHPFCFLLLTTAAMLLSGCVATTVDIDRLHQTMNSIQKSQADLVAKMDTLEQSLVAMREEMRDHQSKVTTLSRRMDDTQQLLGVRMDNISQLLSQTTVAAHPSQAQAPAVIPGDLYKSAYADYISGKIDLAEKGFKSFIDQYPQSDLNDQALFYLGDCSLVKKDFALALSHFDKVLSISRQLRSQALLKRAHALAGLKRVENERVTLQTLMKEYPNSPEAQTAREMLDELPNPFATHPKKKKTASTNKTSKKELE